MTELETDSGGRRYFEALQSPVYDDRKNMIGRLIIFRDITHRKENELRLLQLNQAVEQSPASVMITDLNGNITIPASCNRGSRQMLSTTTCGVRSRRDKHGTANF
jgi:PAS domain-containing protein